MSYFLTTIVISLSALVMPVLLSPFGSMARGQLWVERTLLVISCVVIAFETVFVTAEVFMRYLFNAPIAGHVETSELLLPAIIFLAFPYTQMVRGHVGMDLVTGFMPVRMLRSMEITALLFTIPVCFFIATYTAAYTFELWLYKDVTMSPPFIKTWPSAFVIALGFFMVGTRCALQVLSLVAPRRFGCVYSGQSSENFNESSAH